MKPYVATIALALALVACKRQPASTGNSETASAVNDADTAASESVPATPDSVSPAEPSTTTVKVVEVPAPAAAAPAATAAPLQAAASLASEIDRGGYERVRSGDGWAWRRNGEIVRTASLDGRRVAYFHAGDADPYLVQQDGRAYEYDHGRFNQGFDDRGRPVAADATWRRGADQALADAHSRRDAPPTRKTSDAPHGSDRPDADQHRDSDQASDGRRPQPERNDPPGPHGNRVTEHKGQPDKDHDRSRDTSGSHDDRGDRPQSTDHPSH